MAEQTLGHKIKSFRKRAGYSQLDLEMEIGSSAGTISRIENGQVNPTKETLLNIASTLKLEATETAQLFNIDLQQYSKSEAFSEIEEIKPYDLIREYLSAKIIKELVSDMLGEIEKKMDYIGSSLSVVNLKEDYIHLAYLSRTFVAKFSELFILRSKSFRKLRLKAKAEMTLTKRAVLENRIFVGGRLRDFVSPPLANLEANIVQFIARIETMIALPVKDKEGKVIAVLNFATQKKQVDQSELDALEGIADYIGNLIDSIIIPKINELNK